MWKAVLLRTPKNLTSEGAKKALKLFRGYQALPHPLSGSVVAVGNFDGVHRGHQEIISCVRERATELQANSVLYTFLPHPVKLLAPHLAPPLIHIPAQKYAVFSSLGVDVTIEEPFTREFAAYSPEQFVDEVLHGALRAREIFVGFDFTFGRGGKANAQTLAELGASFGLSVRQLDPISHQGIVASSTKVREFVLAGQVDGARMLLGRPFVMSGVVESGQQRGRTLGFPTANLHAEQELRPAYGVYAAWAQLEQELHPAVVNIGMRPTFRESSPTIEAHLLDFSGDLYGRRMALHLLQRLRPEMTFASLDELKAQIQRDIQKAKESLQTPEDITSQNRQIALP